MAPIFIYEEEEMSIFIFEENDYEKTLKEYFLFFKSAFDKIYNQDVVYNSKDRSFKIDYNDRKKISLTLDDSVACLNDSFDNMLDYIVKNKINDLGFANDVISTIVNYFYSVDVKISADFLSYVLKATKNAALKNNRDFSIVGIDTFILLFRDSLYKQYSTKKERERVYSYIFNERKDLLNLETYNHLSGYCLNKERNISQYFGVGLSLLTKYPEYKNQIINFLRVLVYGKEETPSAYHFKDVDLTSVKVKEIPEEFFENMSIQVLLTLRNYQGVNSKIGKRINEYLYKHSLKDEISLIFFSIYSAITLDKDYIYKINKKYPDIFSKYLNDFFKISYKNPHIIYQCEYFIKQQKLDLDIRSKDFWEDAFYKLILKYAKGGE